MAEDAEETEDMEITLAGWECAYYPEDGAFEGTYTFTVSLPEGFVLAEDVAVLEAEVELGGAVMLAEAVSADYQEAMEQNALLEQALADYEAAEKSVEEIRASRSDAVPEARKEFGIDQ